MPFVDLQPHERVKLALYDLEECKDTANRVKELDDDTSSNFQNTVAPIIHMGGVDRQIDLSAVQILSVAGVCKSLVLPLNLDSPGVFAKPVGEADGNCWNSVWAHGTEQTAPLILREQLIRPRKSPENSI